MQIIELALTLFISSIYFKRNYNQKSKKIIPIWQIEFVHVQITCNICFLHLFSNIFLNKYKYLKFIRWLVLWLPTKHFIDKVKAGKRKENLSLLRWKKLTFSKVFLKFSQMLVNLSEYINVTFFLLQKIRVDSRNVNFLIET